MKLRLCKCIFAAAALAMLVPVAVRAQGIDNDGCSNRTLRGDYSFTINGQVFPPGKPAVTRDGVAVANFDGKTDINGNGGLTQVDFVMQYPDMSGGSSPVPNADPPDSTTSFNVGETGTYRVFNDCTGEAEIDFPPQGGGGAVIKFRFVLSYDGSAIHTTVYYVQPPGATMPVPALIHSEGWRLK
ncbi:MAG: hypothetical protein WA405_08885 [Candidatus Acidiferrales bacterium]